MRCQLSKASLTDEKKASLCKKKSLKEQYWKHFELCLFLSQEAKIKSYCGVYHHRGIRSKHGNQLIANKEAQSNSPSLVRTGS